MSLLEGIEVEGEKRLADLELKAKKLTLLSLGHS